MLLCLVNPASGRGRSLRIAEDLCRGLRKAGREVVLESSKGPGWIARRASSAPEGTTAVIAVGGDGTINEVVNGFFENEDPIGKDATLAIIPHGTGMDFCRILDRQHSGEQRMVDLMKVLYTTPDGASRIRYAINVTSFGMGGEVAARVSRSTKPFGAIVAFLSSTLAIALNFSGNSVTLQLDNSKTIKSKVTNVVVGNGQYHGAGMWVCPGAVVDDGLLDVTIIGHLTLLELLRNIPTLYTGGIYSHPKVQSYKVKHLKADSREPVLIEIDGEALGRLPLEISVLPQAIRVSLP